MQVILNVGAMDADGFFVDTSVGDVDQPLLEAVLAASTAGVFVTDADGQCLMVNDRWCELTGIAAERARGDGWMAAVHPDDRADVISSWWASTQHVGHFELRYRYRHPDGTVQPIHCTACPVRDAAGSIRYWVGSVVAVPDTVRSIVDDPEFLRAALVNSSDLLVVIDGSATLSYVSPASERILGLRPADWVGRNVMELLHPDDANAAAESLISSIDTGSGVKDPLEVRVRHADGRWREVEIVANNLLHDPAIGGILINARDVSERRLAQRREGQAQGRFELAFQRSPIGMALTTIEGRYERVNEAMCELLGRTPSEMLATSVLDTTHPDDLSATVAAAVDLLEGRTQSFSLDKRMVSGDGRAIWTRATTTLLRGDDGQPQHFLTQVEDIEERRHLLEQLRRSALRDPLTGLANRAGLEEYLSLLPHSTPIGVIALDLDGFKDVNDSSGHAAGDEVLRVVAGRIRRSIRPIDHAARTGGDEFIVVTTMPPSAAKLSGTAARLVHRLHEPVGHGGAVLGVGASAGVAVGVAGDHAAVLKRADDASYAAKRRGGNQVASSAQAS
jgi:diguanylate cyclase (GGDEF)-like protein/PAS domain S-box-containing protein